MNNMTVGSIRTTVNPPLASGIFEALLEKAEREREEARAWSARWKNAAKDWRQLFRDFWRRKHVLAQELDQARAALQEIRDLVQRPAAWDTPNNVSGSLVAIDDICEEAAK